MMAGGVFTAQNKLRAGAYIRFRSAGKASAQVGERGTAAIPLFLSFGESGKFIPIDGETDVEKRLGFPADHKALKLLRECGKRAKKVLVWRLSEGEKASATGGNLTVKAKYGGERGNALVVRVTAEEDGFSVETLLDGKVMDQQEGKTVADLSGNDWVDFSGSGALSAQAGLALTGGSDGEETAESYDKFFKALETADFETFALPTEDKSVIRKAVSFVKRMREEEGKKIQGVVASYPQADCEGILSVKNGVKLEDGRYVCELADDVHAVDAFGHKALTGTARYLANVVARNLDTKTRCIELSTLQRCAGHLTSRTDITEAYQVGGAAAKAAFEGHTGEMVALDRISNAPYQCTTSLHPISEVANLEKKVPLEWVNADHTAMLPEFLAYAMPLIQAELTPIYVEGLPHHIYLPET